MRNNSNILAAVAGAGLAALAPAAVAQQCQVIFAEDFDSVPLGPNVMEGIETGSGGQQEAVWNETVPGWANDEFSCPGDGVTEWQGWSVADGAWWQFTCGDQDRSDFTVDDGHYSSNACLIADGDEWDDHNRQGICGPDGYTCSIDTPAIDLTGVTEGTVKIGFYSSWRDEIAQKVYVDVSFDGGANFSRVLFWTSDPNDPDFHDDAPNEVVSIDVNNPAGADSMIIRFGMFDADNNWWWAIDDISVTAETTGATSFPPAPFFIDVDTFNLNPGAEITWGAACGAEDYTIELAKDADFTDVWHTDTTTGLSYTIPGIVPTGIYYARVVAGNAAGDQPNTNLRRIVLDNPCLADTNGDGVANTLDFIEYLNRWVTGCP